MMKKGVVKRNKNTFLLFVNCKLIIILYLCTFFNMNILIKL